MKSCLEGALLCAVENKEEEVEEEAMQPREASLHRGLSNSTTSGNGERGHRESYRGGSRKISAIDKVAVRYLHPRACYEIISKNKNVS